MRRIMPVMRSNQLTRSPFFDEQRVNPRDFEKLIKSNPQVPKRVLSGPRGALVGALAWTLDRGPLLPPISIKSRLGTAVGVVIVVLSFFLSPIMRRS